MNTQMTTPRKHKQILISEVLSESWSLIDGLKMPIFLRMLVLLAVTFVMPLIIGTILFFTVMHGSKEVLAILVLPILLYICIAVFAYAIIASTGILLGVRQAAGMSLDGKLVNAECLKMKWPVFALFMIGFVIAVVMKLIFSILIFIHIPRAVIGLLSFIPILYFILPIHVFAVPLVLTKHCSIETALRSSYAKMKIYWLPVITCYIIITALIICSYFLTGIVLVVMPSIFWFLIIPVPIIVLIWFLPMLFAIYGVLFRDAYGLQKRGQNSKQSPAGPAAPSSAAGQEPAEPDLLLPDLGIDIPPEEKPPGT